jgi:hypothetical protein
MRNCLIGGITVLVLGAGVMFWINHNGSAKENKLSPIEESEQNSQFGADRVKDDFKPVPFDGKRAMKYLQSICALGPRMSGTGGMRKQQDLIKKHFEDLNAKVTYQSFEAEQKSVRGKIPMTNIIVSYFPEKKRRVIICSHYDTRPFADQEDDPRDAKKPNAFVSANDGGSGVALMMEMAHHMKDLKTNVGVDFVCFDGEEQIFKRDFDRYFIGSEHFAKTWRADKNRCDYSAAILLDMIAGKNLSLPVEVNSYRFHRPLCEEVYSIAKELQVREFVWKQGHEVQDDHLALQKVGIPAIDIIDFDYVYWHKLADTPAACSPASFEKVAKVLSVWMQKTK